MNDLETQKKVFIYLNKLRSCQEFYTTFKDECSHKEKHSLNQFDRDIDFLINKYKRQGLFDHPASEEIISKYLDVDYEILSCVVDV